MLALGALCVLYAAMAAFPAAPGSNLVLATVGGSPDWLLGPLRFAGLSGADGPLAGPLFYLALWLALLLYAAVLIRHRDIPARSVLWVIGGLHLLFLLAPPLLSQDVFSYIAYARMGVEHSLNPYTHTPLDIPTDPVFPFAGSKDAVSVYGPVFTLLTYPLAPLGVAASFWVLKVVSAACSFGIVALVWGAARRLGRDPVLPALIVGLNPLTLVHVVGGAHNEALLMLIVVAALGLGSRVSGVGGVAAGVSIKASAGVVAPYLVVGAREQWRRALLIAVAVLAGIALLGLAVFGTHALDALGFLNSNQERSSRWSFPYKTAQLLGALLPGERLDYRDAVRIVYGVAFAVVALWLLVRTWRGMDPIRAAGWATLALLIASAWLVPWYALWLLPLVALTLDRRLLIATTALCAWMLVIAVPL
ncbi:MAG TPA: polyprenol phosphomannose-dependent alpha 1,6 mannosyltransferase MptB [Thermoleophilaceae bacterium]|nr:polyprenol phosphomannose-dependent alpha 1,6 mannosyltransferase MptB [Thermoleophilaceae bacterium]